MALGHHRPSLVTGHQVPLWRPEGVHAPTRHRRWSGGVRLQPSFRGAPPVGGAVVHLLVSGVVSSGPSSFRAWCGGRGGVCCGHHRHQAYVVHVGTLGLPSMGKTGKYFRPSAAAAASSVVSVSVGHGQLPVGETKVRVSTFAGVDGGLVMPSQPLDDVTLCSPWDLLECVYPLGCCSEPCASVFCCLDGRSAVD